MNRREWLDSLKDGDVVVTRTDRLDTFPWLTLYVTRLTPQTIWFGKLRYGKEQDAFWGKDQPGKIEPLTDEIREECRRVRLIAKVRCAAQRLDGTSAVTTERLLDVLTLLGESDDSDGAEPLSVLSVDWK